MLPFDIIYYSYTDDCIKISISTNETRVEIALIKMEDIGMWLVPTLELHKVPEEHFLMFYPMLLGVLLTALHEHKADMPMEGIGFKDIDAAFEIGSLKKLAESVAKNHM